MRLRDQAQQSAAESKELRPSTLLVLLAMYRAFGVLDRNQAEERTRRAIAPGLSALLTAVPADIEPGGLPTAARVLRERRRSRGRG